MSGNALTRTLIGPLAVALHLLLSTTCFAVIMDVKIGFDGAAKCSAWTPVAVQMTNDSDEDIEGALTVEQPEMAKPYLAQCMAVVSLPAHSKKLYHTYVRMSDFGGRTYVRLVRGGGIYGMKQINVDPFARTDKLVVSVGGRTTRLNFLNNEQVPIPPKWDPRYGGYSSGVTDATIHVGSVAQSMLPDRPAGYESIDVLVLSELTPSAVNPRALKALAMWVQSGGTLVIPTGPNYRVFMNDFYDELLPVSISGAVELPGLAGLSRLGRSPFPASPVAVAQSAVKPGVGRVLLAEGSVPIIAERPYGAGRVLFFAFDHLSSPFRDWNGQTDFWKNIVRPQPRSPMVSDAAREFDEAYFSNRRNYGYNYGPQNNPEPGLAGVVAQNPSVRAPSFNSVGLFLLSYLVMLVPVNYFVLKRMRRLELAWVTTPAVVILFVLGAYAMGYTMKGGQLRLCQATIVEASAGERFARVVTVGSLFSPARRAYDLNVADPFSVSQAIPTDEKERLPITLLAEKSLISDMGMAMWSSKTIESVSGLDLEGRLDASLVLTGKRLQGEVRNSTGTALRDCVVTYGQATMQLGDLPVGGSAKIDIAYDAFRGGSGYGATPGVGKLDDRLHTQALALAGTSNSPVLVARPVMKEAVLSVERHGSVEESATQCLFRLRYRTGGAFEIPDSQMTRSVISSNNANIEGPHEASGPQAGSLSVSFYGNGNCVATYRMQVPPGGQITALKLDLRAKGGGAATPVELSAYNLSSGNWDVVSAKPVATVKNFGEYVTSDGELKLRMKQSGGSSANVVLDVIAQGAAR